MNEEAKREDVVSGTREGAILRAAQIYLWTQNLTKALTSAYEDGWQARGRDPKLDEAVKVVEGKRTLAQRMEREAKSWYDRYTAGEKPTRETVLMLSTFGVHLHNTGQASRLILDNINPQKEEGQ